MDAYSFQAQVNRISPIGLVPEGLRIDVGFAGTVSGGPLAGSAIEGIDYLLIRPDGVAVIDVRELISGADGATVSVRADGYVEAPFEMPPLSVLGDPSFSWPDVDLPLHGSARLQSAAPALEAVNHSAYAFTGAVNMARGSLLVDARRIAATAGNMQGDLLARGYAAFAAGDVDAVMSLFRPDIAWHVPGASPLAGDYKGTEQVGGFFGQLQERSGGTFALEPREILAGPDHVVALVTERASMNGSRLDAAAVHVWRFDGEQAVEFVAHYADQAAVDAFWSQTG